MRKLISVGLQTIGRLSLWLGGWFVFALWRRLFVCGWVCLDEQIVHNVAKVELIDGVWMYVWGDGRRLVLFVYGWRSRVLRYAGFITRLLEFGYSLVSYDAFAHGDFGGDVVSIFGHQQLICALEERYGLFEGVIVYFFGVLFALYAVCQGVAAQWMVMISGVADFGYLVDMFCAELGLGPKLNRELWRSIECGYFDGDTIIWDCFSVKTGKTELFVVHNDEDNVVDLHQAQLLFWNYGFYAHFYLIIGFGHCCILLNPAVIAEVVVFL